jgi:hypothetical protein
MLAINMNKYSLDNVFFNEQQKNSLNDTNFIRLIYSSKLFSLQGITISFDLSTSSFDLLPNKYNKYKCVFSIIENNHVVQFIKELEYNLINQVSFHNYNVNKIPNYKLIEQFQNGEIKVCKLLNEQSTKTQNTNTIIIKISGIWSSNDYYGLTYKFLTPN